LAVQLVHLAAQFATGLASSCAHAGSMRAGAAQTGRSDERIARLQAVDDDLHELLLRRTKAKWPGAVAQPGPFATIDASQATRQRGGGPGGAAGAPTTLRIAIVDAARKARRAVEAVDA
jgi:hypothetical protein